MMRLRLFLSRIPQASSGLLAHPSNPHTFNFTGRFLQRFNRRLSRTPDLDENMLKLLFTGFFALIWASQIPAASFDCAKAKSNIERTICSNDELSDLDSRMSQSYKNALKNNKDKNPLKTRQSLWLKHERNVCLNPDCLRSVYLERIEELARNPATAAGDPLSCRDEIGKDKAAVYVRQCSEISPATHPPCNDLNPCEMIKEEIKRGCELAQSMQGFTVPKFCN